MKHYILWRRKPGRRKYDPIGYPAIDAIFEGECDTPDEFLDWVVWKLNLASDEISKAQRVGIRKRLAVSASHTATFNIRNRGVFEVSEEEKPT